MSARIDTFRQQKPGATGRDAARGSAKQRKPVTANSAARAEESADEAQAEAQLRAFDLDSQFGGCIGLTRLERWQRADMLGLDPPPHVKELVLQAGESSTRNNCIWFGRT